LQLLDKSPDASTAALGKSLKAVALLRLGRGEDARATVEDLRRANSGAGLANADALMLAGFVLSELGRGQDALDLHDQAIKLAGASEDVAIEAFQFYVRIGELKRMQVRSLRYRAI